MSNTLIQMKQIIRKICIFCNLSKALVFTLSNLSPHEILLNGESESRLSIAVPCGHLAAKNREQQTA